MHLFWELFNLKLPSCWKSKYINGSRGTDKKMRDHQFDWGGGKRITSIKYLSSYMENAPPPTYV